MDKRAPIIVARARTGSEAFVIKNLLESYHIPCHYASRLSLVIHPLNIQCPGEIRIYVPAALAQEAQRILDEHRRNNLHLRLVEAE